MPIPVILNQFPKRLPKNLTKYLPEKFPKGNSEGFFVKIAIPKESSEVIAEGTLKNNAEKFTKNSLKYVQKNYKRNYHRLN